MASKSKTAKPAKIARTDGSKASAFVEASAKRDRDFSEARALSEERFRMAMEAAKIGTFDWNMNTGQVYWSPNLESFMGLPTGGFAGDFKAFERFVYPEDSEKVQQAVQHSIETGADYQVEFRMIRPDQTIRWVQARGRIYRDDTGKPVRMVGIDIDITDRKSVEVELIRSRAEAKAQADDLAAILDAVPAMTFIARDPECKTVTSSRTAHELLRLPPGANSSKSAPPEERPSHFQMMKNGRVLSPEELPLQKAAKTARAVRDVELRIAFVGGTWLDVYGHAVPLLDEEGSVRGAVGAFVDITERKKIEERLKQNEARFRSFIDSNLIGIASSTLEGGMFEANDNFLHMLGYSREEFRAGKFDWKKITPAEFLARGQQAVEELKATGIFSPFEKEYIRKDGSRIPVLIGAATISQNPLEWMCFILDLTERKRIEELKAKDRIQKELLEHEMLAREEERRHIARELHDESGQMLASLLAGLSMIRNAKDLREAKLRAGRLQKITSKTMDELGRLSRGLHSLTLDDLGLVPALRAYADEYRKLHGIRVKLQIVGLRSRRLSRSIEVGLYRIAQEALTNISKHARAKSATIFLNMDEEFLDLKISDDGRGFDPKQIPSNHHLGLQGMRERVSMLGGEFTVQSRKGGGTLKTIRIPVAFANREKSSPAE